MTFTSNIAADMPSLKDELTSAVESLIDAWISDRGRLSNSKTPDNLQTKIWRQSELSLAPGIG